MILLRRGCYNRNMLTLKSDKEAIRSSSSFVADEARGSAAFCCECMTWRSICSFPKEKSIISQFNDVIIVIVGYFEIT